MNKSVLKLIKEMNISIFTEQELVDTEIVVIFPGNFQPMGQHQREEYQRLCRKFGVDNVFVITDEQVDGKKHPFSFEEKLQIMKRHGITNIKSTNNPFAPNEILKEFDETNTVVIFAVSQKNVKQLKSYKRLTKYNGSAKLPMKDIQNPYVYYIITNEVKYEIPGVGLLNFENIRKSLEDSDVKQSELKRRFISIFGWFDEKIFNVVIKKLNPTKTKIAERKKSNPLALVTRTFWNKVYNEIK